MITQKKNWKSDIRKIVGEETKRVVQEETMRIVQEETRKIVKEELAFYPTKVEFYKKMDEVVTELQNLRDEVSVVTGYKDQIEDHEVRIEKLEQKVV